MYANAVLVKIPILLVVVLAASACINRSPNHDPLSRKHAEALLMAVQAAAMEDKPRSCQREDNWDPEGDEVRLLLSASATDILSFGRPGDMPATDAIEIYVRTESQEETLGILVYLKDGQCDRYALSRAWS